MASAIQALSPIDHLAPPSSTKPAAAASSSTTAIACSMRAAAGSIAGIRGNARRHFDAGHSLPAGRGIRGGGLTATAGIRSTGRSRDQSRSVCLQIGAAFGLTADDAGFKGLDLVLRPSQQHQQRHQLVAAKRKGNQRIASVRSSTEKQEGILEESKRDGSDKEQAGGLDLNCIGQGVSVECIVVQESAWKEAGGQEAAASDVGPTAEGGGKRQEGGDGVEDLDLNCVATGIAVECVTQEESEGSIQRGSRVEEERKSGSSVFAASAASLSSLLGILLLISPFFFWGTAMVAMKDVLPRAGPMFVAAVRLMPAGALLVAFASFKGRPQPSSAAAWAAILLFALVDATAFQGFLAEGLKRTSAGLGSVIIDSQPLTVALLAALLFGESIGSVGAAGLALGVVGLCLLEIPLDSFLAATSILESSPTAAAVAALPPLSAESLLESGEFWMLLAAQSMAVGTVMVRWVCRQVDPVMATGWHMIIGGLPLLVLSVAASEPAVTTGLDDLSLLDWGLLGYTTIFGSAVSYGVFFYNANKGNLTQLSSLTFLTPMFAALFGFIFLDETFNSWQLFGAIVTIASIYLVNWKPSKS